MGCQWGFCTKEGKEHSVSREGCGDCLLGFAKNNLHRLFGKCQTIIGAYCASLLDRLKTKLQEKRSRLAHKRVLLYQDNAPAYSSAVVVEKLIELRFQFIPNPPHFPAPSNYCLFPNMKNWFLFVRTPYL